MMALHPPQQNHLRRSSNPMSISSLLNDHDPSDSNALDLLLNIGQRPLPPITTSCNRHTDSSNLYQPQPQRTGYQTHGAETECSSPSSTASSALRRGSVARAPRPKYSDDQGYFIWYHRTDLAEPWDKVLQEFAKQFNHRRPKGGLQCKFYRLLGDWGVEKVREQARQSQTRSRDRVGQYGLVQRTNLRFDWMQPEHVTAPALPQFATTHPNSPGASPCPGCDECYTIKSHGASSARL